MLYDVRGLIYVVVKTMNGLLIIYTPLPLLILFFTILVSSSIGERSIDFSKTQSPIQFATLGNSKVIKFNLWKPLEK